MREAEFLALCEQERNGALAGLEAGIGTLAERGVHRVVKQWLEPRSEMREVSVGRYKADIMNENGIFEVQTRNFYRLQKKLEVFLPLYHVTVVYPVAGVKWVRWLNPQTGEISERRRSPKRGVPLDILYELAAIKQLLQNPNLSFLVPLLEVEEIRLLNGWGAGGKRGARRAASAPAALLGQAVFNGGQSFAAALPPGLLAAPFTVKELGAGLGRKNGRFAANATGALVALGVVKPAGKRGRATLYIHTQ